MNSDWSWTLGGPAEAQAHILNRSFTHRLLLQNLHLTLPERTWVDPPSKE
jgi:hypothetical protein